MAGGDTSRSLSSDVKTQLASGSFIMAHLVKLELNTSHYFTDSNSDIVDGSDTYSANGFLHGLSAVSESANININSFMWLTFDSSMSGEIFINKGLLIFFSFFNRFNFSNNSESDFFS